MINVLTKEFAFEITEIELTLQHIHSVISFVRLILTVLYFICFSRIGKARRGDYSLTDNDGPAFKHTYNREALIDFPAEQRYRQLVNHYGQEKPPDTRTKSLPTRGRKKREAREAREAREPAPEEPRPVPTMRVGRVTVTAPTMV